MVTVTSSYGQTTEPSESASVNREDKIEKPKEDIQKLVWISFYGSGGLSHWTHSEGAVTSDPDMVFGGGFGINFRIKNWLELSTEARVLSFSPEIRVEDFNGSMMAIDNEGNEYEKRVSASGVNEEQKYIWAGIPLAIRYVFNHRRWDFYAEAGGEYCIALKSSFDQTDRFSHHGYYSEYDLLIDDLSSLGFYDEKTLTSIGELEQGNLILPFMGAGVVFPGEAAHLFIEGRYYIQSNDPFSEKQDLLFEGPLNNESVMNSGKVTLSGFRGVIGIWF